VLDNGISGENHQSDEHRVVWLTPSRRWGDRDGVIENKYYANAYLSSLTLWAWESRFKASNHPLTLTPIILTLTQLTNLKISVKIIELSKQNWIAHYGNSDPLVICFNIFLSQLVTFTHKGIEVLHIIQNLIPNDVANIQWRLQTLTQTFYVLFGGWAWKGDLMPWSVTLTLKAWDLTGMH
jgi:hypothetical protein